MAINYLKNREYFNKQSIVGGVILIIAGIIAAIIGGCMVPSNSTQTIGICILIIGLVLLGLGILVIYLIRRKTVSDKMYDAAVFAEIENVKIKAYEHLNIDQEQVNLIPPIFLHQYTTERIKMPVHWKFGKYDNKIRTSNIECMAMFFSEHQIFCYYEQFSMTDREDYIETKEYFYSDIDSMEINKSNVRKSAKDEVNSKRAAKLAKINSFSYLWEKFVITTFSGSQYSLTTRRYVSKASQSNKNKSQRDLNATFEQNSAIAEKEIMDIDRILHGIINLWRQKKLAP